MAGLNHSVRAILKPPGDTSIAWAVFDAAWYRAAHPELADQCETGDAAALAHYFDHGQAAGWSPNPWFDETWFRAAYRGIAARIAAGGYESGFDAYCSVLGAGRSPHWLFDETGYRQRYPDLDGDTLAAAGFVNGYDHFLRNGCVEGRIGHDLFDSAYYLRHLEPEEARVAEEEGPFQYFLHRLKQGTPDVPTSALFDPGWYRERYKAALDAGGWRSALEHYLLNGTPTAFDPSPYFSETWYLGRNPGLARMIAEGAFRNGYAHFLRHGARELRAPNESIDLTWYAALERVQDDIADKRAANAFAHWVTIGRELGLPSAPSPEDIIDPRQARTLFRRRAANQMTLFRRRPLVFDDVAAPDVTVVMAASGDPAMTYASLSTVRLTFAGKIELVLIDGGSDQAAGTAGRFIRNAAVLPIDPGADPARAREAAAELARAGAVLFLADTVELAPGAIEAALARLASSPDIGAVCGMVLGADEAVAEAGGIIWGDGRLELFGRGGSPAQPELTFARDTDFGLSRFVLVRREVLTGLRAGAAGLSAPAYRDADFCVRIALAGFRVVYDPVVILRDYAAPALTDASAGERAVFLAAHPDRDRPDHVRTDKAVATARHARLPSTRVLFIDDMVPLRIFGSGFVRSNDLIRTMAGLGYQVTVFPMHRARLDVADVRGDMPDQVEVMQNRGVDDLAAFLDLRPGYYSVIWVARTHNLDRAAPLLRHVRTPDGSPVRVVLDTEAIASVRDWERARLDGTLFDLDAAIERELGRARECDAVVAVSAAEAARLRDIGLPNVAVIGHVREPRPTPRPFARRAGMLFVGAIHQPGSPNHDSLLWFTEAVLPLVEKALGWETRLTVAGYTVPGIDLGPLRDHPRVTLRGAVTDLTPLYDSHRVFVAPTRFAAGAPYKVHEAASHGLPVMATALLTEQLGWESGRDIISAGADDPALFARLLIELYRDEALWTGVRQSALTRVERENNADSYAAAVVETVEVSRP